MRRRSWVLLAADFLLPLTAIGVAIYLLRDVLSDLLRQEFQGLGAVFCFLAYAGLFLWCVSLALAQDTRQAEEANRGVGSSLSSFEKRERIQRQNVEFKRPPSPTSFRKRAAHEHGE